MNDVRSINSSWEEVEEVSDFFDDIFYDVSNFRLKFFYFLPGSAAWLQKGNKKCRSTQNALSKQNVGPMHFNMTFKHYSPRGSTEELLNQKSRLQFLFFTSLKFRGETKNKFSPNQLNYGIQGLREGCVG